jgi:uncharacterized protein YdcH (DUF465 family)
MRPAFALGLIPVKVRRRSAGYPFIVNANKETDMSHTPHELAEEFPAEVGKMSALKETDPHFAKLMDDYHTVNRQIHRAETRVEPMSEDAEEALRKERAHLKDLLWKRLSA